MFYCDRNRFNEFKHADIKDMKSVDDGFCEATIPVVKGHHVT